MPSDGVGSVTPSDSIGEAWTGSTSGPGVGSLYDVLQVSPRAHLEVITAAYRVLSRQYHPDVNLSSTAARQMQMLNEAYVVLSDPDRRARYDAKRAWAAREATLPGETRRVSKPRTVRAHARHVSRPVDGEMSSSARTVVLAVLTTLVIGIAMALWVALDVPDDGLDEGFGETIISGEQPQDFRLRPIIAPSELEAGGSFGSTASEFSQQPPPSGSFGNPCQGATPWWSSC